MGRTPTDDRVDTIESLRPHHRAMARSLTAGNTPMDIAKRYGFTPAHITKIINSPLFKAEQQRLEILTEKVLIDSELLSLQPRAVEIIAEDMFRDMPSDKRTDTAFKLLDRTGYHPKNEQKGIDNRRYTFVNLAPMPGENPEEAEKRIKIIRDVVASEMKQDAIEAEFRDLDQEA